MDTPYEVMIFDKVIKEIDRQGFKTNRDLTGNLFVTMKKQRNIETKVYKKLTRYEAKKLFQLRSHHAGVGCYKAKFLGKIICNEIIFSHLLITTFFDPVQWPFPIYFHFMPPRFSLDPAELLNENSFDSQFSLNF